MKLLQVLFFLIFISTKSQVLTGDYRIGNSYMHFSFDENGDLRLIHRAGYCGIGTVKSGSYKIILDTLSINYYNYDDLRIIEKKNEKIPRKDSLQKIMVNIFDKDSKSKVDFYLDSDNYFDDFFFSNDEIFNPNNECTFLPKNFNLNIHLAKVDGILDRIEIKSEFDYKIELFIDKKIIYSFF